MLFEFYKKKNLTHKRKLTLLELRFGIKSTSIRGWIERNFRHPLRICFALAERTVKIDGIFLYFFIIHSTRFPLEVTRCGIGLRCLPISIIVVTFFVTGFWLFRSSIEYIGTKRYIHWFSGTAVVYYSFWQQSQSSAVFFKWLSITRKHSFRYTFL